MEIESSQVLEDHLIDREPVPSVAVLRERFVAVDGLRILAAIGIVWFHTMEAPYRQVGYAGLPVFLLIFFSLTVYHGQGCSTATFLKRRWNRLLKPWLFWSLLYGIMQLVKGLCFGDTDSLRRLASLEVILIGTHIHLWYLPFAFVLGVLVYVLNRRTEHFNHIAVILVATVLGMLILAAYATFVVPRNLADPLPQWGFGLAAAPLGLAIGRSLLVPSETMRRLLLASISLGTLAMWWLFIRLGYTAEGIPYSLAVVLVSLAYAWQANASSIVAALAPLTFGIYLIHPFVSFWLRRLVGADQHCVAFIALTVCISGLLTLGLTKTRLRAFV